MMTPCSVDTDSTRLNFVRWLPSGEEAASGAQHQWVDHQRVLVDQIGNEERTDQYAAAHDHECRVDAFLEVRYGVALTAIPEI
jgi:hypothetical protein